MTVKIITDSTSDISPKLAKELGIHVVPGYVRFGKSIYKDGADISKSEFYRQLVDYPLAPVTFEASVNDFSQVYSSYQGISDGIVSIHISSKISRMYDSALKGRKKAKTDLPIDVVDSRFASIGLGLIVMNAARLAKAGESIQNITRETESAIKRTTMLGLFDTLKYVAGGGRVTKHVIELSGIFNIKPLLTFQNGEIVVEGLARSYTNGIDSLFEFVNSTPQIQELAIAYSTDYNSAIAFRQRLVSIVPEERIYIEQIGAALGAHCGPDAIFVAVKRA